MHRQLMWFVAITLTAGIGYIIIDAVQRADTSLKILTQGMGTPDNPSREAVRAAEWNISYLLGLILGFATGVELVVGLAMWWRLYRSYFPNQGNPMSVTALDTALKNDSQSV